MVRKIAPWLLCAVMVTLVGCASGNKGLERPLDSLDATGPISDGRSTPPMVSIYYNYDSSGIRKDQVSSLEYNAEFIKTVPGKVRIEGNTDPRGTNEYNMALGERRALSAKKFLVYLGIPEDKFDTVSYGEENRKSTDPKDYVLDRRSDFVVE